MSEVRPQEIDNKIQEYRKAVDRDPGSPLFVPLAQAYLAINNPAEALEVCRSGLAFLPDLPEGRLVLAKTLCRLGRLREAEAELAALVALAPSLEEAPDLLAQLRAGQLVTLDIRPAKMPAPLQRDDESNTRGLMRPAVSARHDDDDDEEIEELQEELQDGDDDDEFPAEKTIGQGAPIPQGLAAPSEEEIDGQATVQGPPLRRSGIITPPPSALPREAEARRSGVFTPPPSTGSIGAIFEDDDDDDDDGESTRPLIEMKQQTEARLSWQERSKLIQEDRGGLADLFSASPGKKNTAKPSILSPELRKSLDSSSKPNEASNVIGTKELPTTELRKSSDSRPPSLITPKTADSKHPEEQDPRQSAKMQMMPNFRSSTASASFKAIQKFDSKPSQAAVIKPPPIEIPPPDQPPEPPKRRTQVVAKANKTPMFSPIEEMKGSAPPKAEALEEEQAPMLPGKQKFPTAPLVPAVKHKPIMELLDAPKYDEGRHPSELAPRKAPSGSSLSAPQKSPSGSQQNHALPRPNPPISSPSPDFFSPIPAPPSQVIGPAPLGPQEIPILPPEKKAPKLPWHLIGLGGGVVILIIAALFFYTQKNKRRDEVAALLGAVNNLVTEGNAAGLLSAEGLLSQASSISPNENSVLSQIALVEGMRRLVLREERTERLGDALARAKANQFTDENIALGEIALASQSDMKLALQQAQDARVKFSQSALLAFAQGFLEGEQGKLNEARAHLKEALSLSPDLVWARLSLAEHYAFTNDPELAPLLEAELRDRPGSTKALAFALLRYNGNKNLPNESELREQLKRAFKLDLGKREAEWVRIALARNYYLSANDQESDLFSEPFAKTPAQNPMVAVLAAELFYAKGQHTLARENLLSASKLLPEEYWAAPLCEAMLNAKRIPDVEPLLSKLPEGAKAHYLRGRLLLLLKDSARAVVELSEAVKQDPSQQSAVFYAMLAVLEKQDTNLETINTLSTKLNAMGIPQDPPRALPAPYPRSLPLLVKSRILRAQNKPDEVQKLLSFGLTLTPKDELLIQENSAQ